MPSGMAVTLVDLSNEPCPYDFTQCCRYLKHTIRGAPFMKAIVSLFRVLAEIRRHEFVSIHYVSPFMAFLSLFAPGKLVLSFWGSDGLVSYAGSNGVKKAVFDAALRKAHVVTYNSRPLGAALHDFEAKARRVDWPIEGELFKPLAEAERGAARRNRGISEKAIVLFSNRAVRKEYRILEIINACAAALCSAGMSMIVHVPPGSDAEYLAACKSAASGLPIQFSEENLYSGDMAVLCGVSDFYLAFAVSDSFPSSLVEACACGCIAICATDTPAYELIKQDFPIETADLAALSKPYFESLMASRDRRLEESRRVIARSYTFEAFRRSLAEVYS